MSKKVSASGKKRSAWLSKLNFTCRGELFLENERFRKDNSSNILFLDYEWNLFGQLEKKFKACFLRKLFTGSEEWSMENCFVKDQFFVKKFTFWAKVFFKLAEKFQKCYQNCILHAQWIFFWFLKNFKFLIFFWSRGRENVSAFCYEAFRHGCQNFFLRAYKTFLRKMNCFEKRVFTYFFRSLSGSFSDYWCNLSRHGFQKWNLHVPN